MAGSTTNNGQDYAYDSSGRLTDFAGTNYTLDNNQPVHAIKNSGYAYDANGNMTARPNYTLGWDHENRLVSASGEGVYPTEGYLYDPDGMRVKKTSGGVASYYPFAHYEVDRGTVVKYYFFGGMRVAQRRDGVLTYLHGNHLGSTVMETEVVSGTVVNDEQYDAYGSWRGDLSTVNTEHQFTDQKRDDTGLYYYGARYYDPALGQFISPDTIVPNPEHVFDYNRFMYGYGNPLNFVDPSGHIAVCFRGGPQNRSDDASDNSDGSADFWNACEQTLTNSGYDSAIHGDILKLANNNLDIGEAIRAIFAQEQTNPNRPVIVVGYSWGGAAALETAYAVSSDRFTAYADSELVAENTATIDLLFLIEAELDGRWAPREISSNVKTAVNLHAQNVFPNVLNFQNGTNHFDGARNIASPKWSNFGRGFFGGYYDWHRIGHTNITTKRNQLGKVTVNPMTFGLIADYTAQTLFSGRPGVQP